MRSELRLTDLKKRERTTSRLMNVKIPVYVAEAIQRVANELGASKTEVVVALLNEGLEVASSAIKGLRLPKREAQNPKRVCSVADCDRPSIAKGFCTLHYQSGRR